MAESESLVAQCRSLSSRVRISVKRSIAEHDAFAEDVRSLLRKIEEVEDEARTRNDAIRLDQTKAARGVLSGNGPGGDLRKLCHRRNPWLLRFLLGEKCSVLTLHSDRSLALKEEYHAFRSKAAWFVALWPVILLYGLHHASKNEELTQTLKPMMMLGVQLFLMWLCYLYIALALRENVLIVNGSNIRSWWITHHYLSTVACLLILSLPIDSPSFAIFSHKFLRWSAMQGVVMLVQNRYQRRRMYTRIALGKDSAMDVVTGESSGMRGQSLLLYPLLFLLQFWQMKFGFEVTVAVAPDFGSSKDWFESSDQGLDLRGRRGVFLAGVLFLWMGLMNFLHTVLTLMGKSTLNRQKTK